MILRLNELGITKDGINILEDINITLKPKELLGIVGLNGAGKTTLFKAILGFNNYTGDISIDGESIEYMHDKKRARILSYIPQTLKTPIGMTVEQFVLTGVTPYLNILQTPRKEHYEKVAEALDYMGILLLKDRYINTLSGGERQKAYMSRAILQQTEIMLLDEPCSQLDYAASYRYLDRLNTIVKERNIAAMVTIHDPNLALAFADKIVILHNKTILTKINMKKDQYLKKYLDGLNIIYNNQIEVTMHNKKPILAVVDRGA